MPNMIFMPTSASVLELIRTKGVIVGSWPVKGYDAKDIDIVIAERRAQDAKHPLFEKIKSKIRPEFIHSESPGHIYIDALPQTVELFEGDGLILAEPYKQKGVLTFAQARRRASWIECCGVAMRAVKS